MDLSKLRILDLQTFVTLIKEKNFSKAGQKLGMTQSSVTQVLQKLEDELNTKLIIRTSKSFTLTTTGKIFLDAATEILNSYETCKARINQVDQDELEKLKIAISTTPGEFILPPFFTRFTQDVPGIRLIIEMCNSKKAIDMLLSKDCQVAIVGSIMEQLGADFETITLLRERLVVIVSNNLETVNDEIDLEMIGSLTRVDREPGSGTQHEAFDYINALEQRLKERRAGFAGTRVMQLQSVQATLSAVASDDNLYAIVGFFPAKKYADMHQLKIVKIKGIDMDISRNISLIYSKKEMTDNLKIFLESIQRFFEMRAIFD
ncbi:MAG TPA: LysR family transcriptional regulator [Candidatus Lokiarchaeia archaeon]|nr:LysR family transcriptional regulator [Candidatus Lokiarchaeia archaeon]